MALLDDYKKFLRGQGKSENTIKTYSGHVNEMCIRDSIPGVHSVQNADLSGLCGFERFCGRNFDRADLPLCGAWSWGVCVGSDAGTLSQRQFAERSGLPDVC